MNAKLREKLFTALMGNLNGLEDRATKDGLEAVVTKDLDTIATVLDAHHDELENALHEVRELIEGYVDVKDGDYGQPEANKAMRAVAIIDGVL